MKFYDDRPPRLRALVKNHGTGKIAYLGLFGVLPVELARPSHRWRNTGYAPLSWHSRGQLFLDSLFASPRETILDIDSDSNVDARRQDPGMRYLRQIHPRRRKHWDREGHGHCATYYDSSWLGAVMRRLAEY